MLRTMVVTHRIFVFQIAMINMQKILNEILNDMVSSYHNPQHEPDKKKIKEDTNRVRRIWLMLSQNSHKNLLEDLLKDIVASKIILLIYVFLLGLP